MKKLFISCPMKGRSKENIRKSMDQMHKMAEIIFDQELEVLPTYIEHDPPANTRAAVWYLGESIKKLSEADFFIGIMYTETFKGCGVEAKVARDYGIRSTFVDINDFMPDAVEIEKKWNYGEAVAPMA